VRRRELLAGAAASAVATGCGYALQGRGIGTRMLEQLSEIARRQGIRTFDASVLADNRRMMDVFLDCGYSVTTRVDSGVVHVAIALEPTASFVEKAAQRATRGYRLDEGVLRAAKRGRHRCQSDARQRSAPRFCTTDRDGFTGIHRAGSSGRPRDRRPARVAARRRHTGADRSRDRRGAGGARARRRGRLPREGRARHLRHQRGLRRVGT
jgi:hypothetical protein